MTRWLAPSLIGFLTLVSVMAGVAVAQTTSPPPTTTTAPTTSDESSSGAFDKLSPGNRKIARALFEGQTADATQGGKTLTLDEVAGRKQKGEGWGAIFKDMKSQGLVDAKNLGTLVSKHTRHSGGVVTTASGRTLSDADRGHGLRGPKGHDSDAAVSGASHRGAGGGFSHGSGSGHGNAGGHGRSGGGLGHGRGK